MSPQNHCMLASQRARRHYAGWDAGMVCATVQSGMAANKERDAKMTDQFIHDNEPEFNAFLEETMKTLGERAEAKGICIECLSDRLIVELVSGMARSGVAVSAILAMVGEGLDAAETEAVEKDTTSPHRMH